MCVFHYTEHVFIFITFKSLNRKRKKEWASLPVTLKSFYSAALLDNPLKHFAVLSQIASVYTIHTSQVGLLISFPAIVYHLLLFQKQLSRKRQSKNYYPGGAFFPSYPVCGKRRSPGSRGPKGKKAPRLKVHLHLQLVHK